MPALIKSIQLASGDRIEVSDHLTVVVGPNNVGKSVLLQNTWNHVTSNPPMGGYPQTTIVSGIEIELPARVDVEASLDLLGVRRAPGSYPQGTISEPHWWLRNGQMFLESRLNNLYAPQPLGFMAELGQALGILLSPEARLGQLGQVTVPNLYVEQPSQPLQVLWSNRDLEARLNDLTKRAFGVEITVNRHGGAQTALHIGKPEAEEPSRLETISEYGREVLNLPMAQEQGHGIQAFLGIVLTLISHQYQVVLIDEPEAFLHPPQARLLGEVFVELSRRGTQVIATTHSDDFLQGLLTASAAEADVSVVRLTRPDFTQNRVAQVPPENVKSLFEDPLLRYSSILSGIFYKGVVLCESESDCKYYAAVLDSATLEGTLPKSDLLFTQCGGKDRFNKAVKALEAAKVPTSVIADIDLLANQVKFDELFKTMGGDPDSIRADYNIVASAVRNQAVRAERQYAAYQIEQTLGSANDKYLSPDEAKRIREAVRTSSGWELAKKNGGGALPTGDAIAAFGRLLAEAATLGLFILPVGELERFHQTISGDKATWLRKVFETRAFENSPEARELLSQVMDYIAIHQ